MYVWKLGGKGSCIGVRRGRRSGRSSDPSQEYLTVRYPGNMRTNWHYACANEMIAGVFDPARLAGL